MNYNPNPLTSVDDVKPMEYVLHTWDRQRLNMLLEVKGKMGDKLVVNYLFGKWTRPQDFLVDPKDLYKAEDVYKNGFVLYLHNEKVADVKYKYFMDILHMY